MGPHTTAEGSTQDLQEITMPAHEQATLGGTHVGGGRTRNATGWYHELNEWRTAHKAARHDARLAALTACWDANREAVRLLHADAASDMVAPAHAFSTTTTLCDLGV
jgi:hypothetical protein